MTKLSDTNMEHVTLENLESQFCSDYLKNEFRRLLESLEIATTTMKLYSEYWKYSTHGDLLREALEKMKIKCSL